MDNYIVLPFSTDLNRGDQALVWNTIDIAKKSGFVGEYHMVSIDKNQTIQSQRNGIRVVDSILKHPGRKSKASNTTYNLKLKLNWGLIALSDLFKSLLLLNRFTRMFGILFLSNSEKETYQLIKNSKACFVKGGGFIHSSGKITDSYTIYYSLFHIKLAQALGKPVYFMPNSYGPFKGFAVKKMVKSILDNSNLVTVRESKSSEMLSEINVDHIVYPDLGFFLSKENRNLNTINEIKKNNKGFRLVGITVRPYRFPFADNPQEKYNKYIENMTIFCKWLYENEYLPVFIDHTLSTKTHESDRSAIDEICNNLDFGKYSVVSDVEYNCKDLKEIYSLLDYVVGTRFHSVIFALSEGIPAIAITYGGNKGYGIMKDIKLEEYAISMSEFNFDLISRMFNSLVNNEKDIKIRLNRLKITQENEYLQFVKVLKEKNDAICTRP